MWRLLKKAVTIKCQLTVRIIVETITLLCLCALQVHSLSVAIVFFLLVWMMFTRTHQIHILVVGEIAVMFVHYHWHTVRFAVQCRFLWWVHEHNWTVAQRIIYIDFLSRLPNRWCTSCWELVPLHRDWWRQSHYSLQWKPYWWYPLLHLCSIFISNNWIWNSSNRNCIWCCWKLQYLRYFSELGPLSWWILHIQTSKSST